MGLIGINAILASSLLFAATSGCAAKRGTIGAVLGRRDDGRLFVRDAPKRLAASEAGLIPGDQILLIDGIDARVFSSAELHQKLSGEVAEPVRLTVVRAGRVLRVTVRRTPVPRSTPASEGRDDSEK